MATATPWTAIPPYAGPSPTEQCRHTLVVHHDGSLECEGWESCLADELRHDHSMACEARSCDCSEPIERVPASPRPYAAAA